MISSLPLRVPAARMPGAALALLGLCSLLSIGAVMRAQSASPAVHYTLDEGSGAVARDASAGITATLLGANGLPQWTTGVRNLALVFDGVDDSLRIADSIVAGSPLDLSGKSRTYAAWVRWNSNYTRYIVGSNDGSAHLNGLYTQNSANLGRFRFSVEGGTFADTAVVCTAVTPVAGRWYHVAGTWDGAVARIYVDGASCNASAPGSSDYNMSGDQVHVGSSRGATGFWRGEIDDVRIYDRALAADEVQGLYTTTDTEPPTDTVMPRVAVTSPGAGTVVSGSTQLSADASDNVGVLGVQFLVDGAALGAEDTTAPYAIAWDSRQAANGSHTLSAVARDAAGNAATATGVVVSVENVVDATAPVLSNITADVTTAGASITWTTNEAADTQVEYGSTAAYGSQTARVTALVTAHSQSLAGLAPATLYHYRVHSRDASGNLATSGDRTFMTAAAPPPPLVSAHYRLDEGTGTTTRETSGTGPTGTLIGANGPPQWTTGIRNGALLFDGVDDSVRVTDSIAAGSSLDLSGKSRTYAAWVRWNNNYTRYIVASNDSSAHLNGLYTQNDTNLGRFRFAIDGGTFADIGVVCTAVTPAAGRWYHVAGTWDGSVARIYVDGRACNASAPGSSDYNMSGDQVHVGSSRGGAGFWRGEIDDVRIYDRALAADEVQGLYGTDETAPPADTTPPSVSITAPGGGPAVSGSVQLSAAASDNVGILGVQFLVDGAAVGIEDTTAPYALVWDSRQVTNGSHTISAVTRDAAGNTATATGVAVTVENPVDATPPVLSNIAAAATTTGASITWTTDEAADTQIEYGVTAAYGSQTARLTALVTAHSQSLTGLSSATLYHYRVHSRDGSGNLATSGDRTFMTTAAPPPPAVSAHYRLDEGTGATTREASGTGPTATLMGANGLPQWTGGIRNVALYFDGVDDSVRVTDSIAAGSSLDLTGKSRTYAAWVRWNNNYTKYIIASNDSSAHLSGLYTQNDTNLGRFRFAVEGGTFADVGVVCAAVTPVAGRWYHVVGTWDGAVARIFVDGSACNASAPAKTDYNMSGDQLHVGSSRGATGFWRGEIDDVRIYDRALAAEEIQAVYNGTDSAPNQTPSVAITAPAEGASFVEPGDILIEATAGDSDGRIAEVQFFNGTTLLGSDTSAPYSYRWSGVVPGSYSITVKAVDDRGALGVSPRVNVAVRSALPTVSITATDPDLSESGSNGLLTITRTGSTTQGLTVSYALSGSAVNGVDYSTLTGNAVIAAGERSVAIPVAAIDDTAVEGTEAITVSLLAGSSYLVGGSQTVTLYAGDDDGPASGPIIIDHTAVSLYDDIPAHYMNEVRKMWLNVPGESDSRAFRNGLRYLAAINPAYAASVKESGVPEGPRADALRYSGATWGDVTIATGWMYWYGEEDWFTSELARERTKAHIQNASEIGTPISAIGFGWCIDMCRVDNGLSQIDPVYGIRWGGSSVGGASDDRPWGLDAEDSVLTGNVVNLDTYLEATREIRDFAAARGLAAKVFLSTGPLRGECAGYPPYQAVGYQTFLKNDRIRQYARNHADSILFDFADVVAHNDENQLSTTGYSNAAMSVTYPTMHPDNMVNFDGSNVLTQGEAVADGDGDHIGNTGSVRIAKAAWVLMARLAGWDGRPEKK